MEYARPGVVIFYEDPSYTEIAEAYDRDLVRHKGRRRMESLFMRYNTDLNHKCTIKCRGYEVGESDLRRLGGREIIHYQKPAEQLPPDWTYLCKDREDSRDYMERQPRIAIIDTMRSLYICQISGYVHQCPESTTERQRVCHNLFTDRQENEYCCFSGRLVREAAATYDPYVDTNLAPPRPLTRRDPGKALRSMELARHNAAEAQRSDKERLESYQKREGLREAQRVNRNLGNALSRQETSQSSTSSDPGSTPPSPTKQRQQLKRKYDQVSTSLGVDASVSQKKKKRSVALANGLQASHDNMRAIRVIVSDLTMNEGANRAVNKPAPENVINLAIPENQQYFDYLVSRIGIVYSLLARDKEAARRAGPAKSTAYGAIGLRDVALTVLYMYSRGLMMSTDNLIQRDARLHDLLPRTRDLPWYGVGDDVRQELMQCKDLDTLKRISKYKEGMDHGVYTHVQMAFRNHADGPVALQRLLADL